MGILSTFISRPIFTSMLVASVVVFGVVAFPKIGVDQFPDVEFPVVTVTTVLPGADPETMERDISKKLEDALSTLSGIDSLKSINVEGISQIIVQFKLEKNAAIGAQEVRDKVSAQLAELPREAKNPVVEKFDIGAAPIVTLALSSNLPIEQTTYLAKNTIKDALQQQDGVGSVTIVGGRERQIRMVVKPDILRAYGLGINDVATALQAQSLDAPGGRTLEPNQERIMRLKNEVHRVDEINNLIIANPGGIPTRMRDVATVVDGPEEARSTALYNGKSAVAFTILKQSGANTVAVAKRILNALPDIQKNLPPGNRLDVVSDGSQFIKASIESVQEDMLLGSVLAVFIVLIFLRNGRSTLITATALPTSVIGTFMVMHALNFTFNIITMLALTLSIGLLIDDAIVVIENIIRHLEEGAKPHVAALQGAQQISIAVLAVTLAIVAVFIPVAFMDGIMGRFFYQFGVTVAVAVSISYVVSMTLTPMMSAYILRHNPTQKNAISLGIEQFLTKLENTYAKTLSVILRYRRRTLAGAVLILLLTLGLSPFLKFTFIPAQDKSAFDIVMEMPIGTPLAQTTQAIEAIAQQIKDLPGIESYFTSVGSDSQQKVNLGTLIVNLVKIDKRAYSQEQLQQQLRQTLVRPANMLLTVQDHSDVPGQKSQPVQFNLRGTKWQDLVQTANLLQEAMQQHGGFVDIDSSYRGGKPQIDVTLQAERAANLGINASMVGLALRAYLGGDAIAHFRSLGDSYDMVLALPDNIRGDPAQLGALPLRNAGGELVELRNIAQLIPGTGPAQIDRQSKQRQIGMYANLQNLSLGEAMSFLRDYSAHHFPPTVVAEFDGNAKNLTEAGQVFTKALMLALVLVYMILAAQFESLLDPITIMASLPFALIGAIGGLLITGQQFSMFAMIGVIMLMGLVTKNGILLIEFARQLRHERHMNTTDALIEAGRVRLRPILMTTIAMIAGMIPVALARGDGAALRVPMAIVIMGGLCTSTFLTLGIVPVVYSVFDTLRSRIQRHLQHDSNVEL